ncbi:MAG: hypothetical protein WD035_01155 [Balneolaceae bacterium]
MIDPGLDKALCPVSASQPLSAPCNFNCLFWLTGYKLPAGGLIP